MPSSSSFIHDQRADAMPDPLHLSPLALEPLARERRAPANERSARAAGPIHLSLPIGRRAEWYTRRTKN
jgi:hypothetical protein